jgi:hypothetical protein
MCPGFPSKSDGFLGNETFNSLPNAIADHSYVIDW